MAQITRQIALHASWLRVITLNIKGYLLKAGALGTNSKVQGGGANKFPQGSVLAFVLQSAPPSGSGGKQLLESTFLDSIHVDAIRECWCFKEAWRALGSRSPVTDEKLRTRAVILIQGHSGPRGHLATSVDIFGCFLVGAGGMLLSGTGRSQGCC